MTPSSAPSPRPPAAPSQPPSAAIPPRTGAEAELAVVAVLGYN